MEDTELAPVLDVESRSIRGRACPVCGGKIIPSNTAVFQGQADPSALYVSFQCERCGHQEVFEKPNAAALKHGKPAPTRASSSVSASGAAIGDAGATVSSGSTSAAVNLPPDVRKLLEIMNSSSNHNQG